MKSFATLKDEQVGALTCAGFVLVVTALATIWTLELSGLLKLLQGLTT